MLPMSKSMKKHKKSDPASAFYCKLCRCWYFYIGEEIYRHLLDHRNIVDLLISEIDEGNDQVYDWEALWYGMIVDERQGGFFHLYSFIQNFLDTRLVHSWHQYEWMEHKKAATSPKAVFLCMNVFPQFLGHGLKALTKAGQNAQFRRKPNRYSMKRAFFLLMSRVCDGFKKKEAEGLSILRFVFAICDVSVVYRWVHAAEWIRSVLKSTTLKKWSLLSCNHSGSDLSNALQPAVKTLRSWIGLSAV